MGYHIRESVPDDASALGAIHVRAWQAAYRGGLMPDEYLDSLSMADRADVWRTALESEPRPKRHRLVAVDDDASPVGFIVVGPEDGEEDAGAGEVYALNVDPDHWGRAAGTLLLGEGLASLAGDGFGEAVLWVHPGNSRARRFYESRGWTSDDAERSQEIWGVEVAEVRYRRRLP